MKGRQQQNPAGLSLECVLQWYKLLVLLSWRPGGNLSAVFGLAVGI